MCRHHIITIYLSIPISYNNFNTKGQYKFGATINSVGEGQIINRKFYRGR